MLLARGFLIHGSDTCGVGPGTSRRQPGSAPTLAFTLSMRMEDGTLDSGSRGSGPKMNCREEGGVSIWARRTKRRLRMRKTCKSVDEPPPVGLVEDRKGLAAVPIRPFRDARLDVDPRDGSHRREVFDQVGCAPMPVSSNEPEMHLANSHS